MKSNTEKSLIFGIWAIAIVIIILGIWIIATYERPPGELDDFAACLADEEAKFYGTFWCPYCNQQKKMFGSSVQYLPYIECSTPDGKGQLPVCEEAGITSYPAWTFSDDTKLSGLQSLEALSERTGCELPNEI